MCICQKFSILGAKKSQKLTTFKPDFQHPESSCIIREISWWYFGGKQGSGWVVLAY